MMEKIYRIRPYNLFDSFTRIYIDAGHDTNEDSHIINAGYGDETEGFEDEEERRRRREADKSNEPKPNEDSAPTSSKGEKYDVSLNLPKKVNQSCAYYLYLFRVFRSVLITCFLFMLYLYVSQPLSLQIYYTYYCRKCSTKSKSTRYQFLPI